MATRRAFIQRTAGTVIGLAALRALNGFEALPAFAQDGQVPAGAAWQARHGLSASAYQAEFNALVGQGYRLVDVSGYDAGGEARYAAIWEQCDSPPWQAYHGVT